MCSAPAPAQIARGSVGTPCLGPGTDDRPPPPPEGGGSAEPGRRIYIPLVGLARVVRGVQYDTHIRTTRMDIRGCRIVRLLIVKPPFQPSHRPPRRSPGLSCVRCLYSPRLALWTAAAQIRRRGRMHHVILSESWIYCKYHVRVFSDLPKPLTVRTCIGECEIVCLDVRRCCLAFPFARLIELAVSGQEAGYRDAVSFQSESERQRQSQGTSPVSTASSPVRRAVQPTGSTG